MTTARWPAIAFRACYPRSTSILGLTELWACHDICEGHVTLLAVSGIYQEDSFNSIAFHYFNLPRVEALGL